MFGVLRAWFTVLFKFLGGENCSAKRFWGLKEWEVVGSDGTKDKERNK